jgi:hypothetical protein
MRRIIAMAAILTLAAPISAWAQHDPHGNPHGKPPARAVVPHGGGPQAHGPVVHGPVVHGPVVHGPVVGGPVVHGPVVHGPVGVEHRDVRIGGPGPRGAPFVFHGHEINRVHFARPWVYPSGWGYRRWAVGAVLPALFLAPAYYYTDWASVGLTPPPPGFQWIQYGPDLLLVNVTTGEVIDTAYGVFY